MTHDPQAVKLGKLPVKHDPRTFRLAKYIDKSILPVPPARVDYSTKISDWKMLANDKLGCCTCSAILHMIMLWASQSGAPVPDFTDQDAIDLYSKLCGYVPGDPSTDNGGVMLDILKAWRQAPIHGCELVAFTAVDPTNWQEVKIAHDLFGSLYSGVALPVEAQNETIWTSTSGAPGTWGGHCIPSDAYAEKGGWSCAVDLEQITWGGKQKMTPKWFAKYCDELYAPITPLWLDAMGKAPNGFNIDQLKADLAAL